MKTFLSLGCLALCAVLGSISASAAETKTPPALTKGAEKVRESAPRVRDWIPFHGTIDAVDKSAKTIKIGERTFHAAANTRYKIRLTDKPATFDEAKVGEVVGGSYRKAANGKLELLSLGIGPKPDDDKKEVTKEIKSEEKKPRVITK